MRASLLESALSSPKARLVGLEEPVAKAEADAAPDRVEAALKVDGEEAVDDMVGQESGSFQKATCLSCFRVWNAQQIELRNCIESRYTTNKKTLRSL